MPIIASADDSYMVLLILKSQTTLRISTEPVSFFLATVSNNADSRVTHTDTLDIPSLGLA